MKSKQAFFQQTVAFIASVHSMHYEMTKTMPLHGLTSLQYELLEFLAVEQPLTPSRISECKGISMPNTSRELRKLTEMGLCERLSDATDRRKQYIRLTASGEKYMADAFAHMQAELWKRLEDVDDSGLEQIAEAMALLQEKVFRGK